MPFPPIALDRGASQPLYRQIEHALRRAITDGRIQPGARLPGIRAYARELGVGAVTVMTAYEQLIADGYLETRPGSGTIVAPRASVMAPVAGGGSFAGGSFGGSGSGARLPRPASAEASALPEPVPGPLRPFFEGTRSRPRFDFRTGPGRLDLFPSATWERLLPRAWRDLASDPGPATTYRWPEGDPRLRAELAAYLGMARGVRATPERVVITSGAQGALAAAARLWLGAGRQLAIEDPASPWLRRSLEGLRVELVPVPVDDRGLLVDRLPETATAVLVTPAWQHPAGGTMPVARRLQLLRWAEAAGAVILEDDPDGELRYDGPGLPAIQGLDEAGRVVHVVSTSHLLFPGLRIGAAVVPDAVLDAFIARHEAGARGPGALEQRALALFLAEGHFERHVARLRAAYQERQGALLAALAAELGAVVSARPAAAGTHLVVRIEEPGLTATRLAMRARALGVAIEPLAFSRRIPGDDRDVLLHYARLGPDEIREGVRLLARAAAGSMGAGGGGDAPFPMSGMSAARQP